jgi:hypothetical protein
MQGVALWDSEANVGILLQLERILNQQVLADIPNSC